MLLHPLFIMPKAKIGGRDLRIMEINDGNIVHFSFFFTVYICNILYIQGSHCAVCMWCISCLVDGGLRPVSTKALSKT